MRITISFGLIAVAFGLLLTSTSVWAQSNTQKAPTKGTVPNDKDQVDIIVNQVFDNLSEISDQHYHEGEYNHIVNIARLNQLARPKDLNSVANAGWLLWSMDRDQEALTLYQQSLKDNPKTFFMYDEIAYYYFQHKKDYNASPTYYIQAAKLPDVPQFSLHMYAHCYEKLGDLNKALAVWKRCCADESDLVAKANHDKIRRRIAEKVRSH